MAVLLGAIKGTKRITLNADEKQFIREESQNSGQGFKYRAKILYGRSILLKERNNFPVQKWYMDFDVAKKIAEKLNKLK